MNEPKAQKIKESSHSQGLNRLASRCSGGWLMGVPVLMGISFFAVAMGDSLSAFAREECARFMAKLNPKLQRILASPKMIDVTLAHPSGKELLALERDPKKALFYAITNDDRLFFSSVPVELETATPTFVLAPSAQGKAEVVPLRESGQIRYQAELDQEHLENAVILGRGGKHKSFIFQQTSGLDPSGDEIRNLVKQLNSPELPDLAEVGSNYRFVKSFSAGGSQARVFECTKILEKSTRGEKFIWDSIMSTTAIQIAGIAVTSPERFTDSGHYNLLAGDLSTPAINTWLRSMASYFMLSKNQSTARRYAVRFGVIGPSVGIQAGVYELLDTDKVLSMSGYATGYSVLMIPKGDLMDKFVLQRIPSLSYEACLRNSSLRWIYSQRAVRIIDGIVSTVIFLEGRKAIVGH
ncbi:MAG: hypothetical protein RJB38_1572 [Pseudomonadota bacterium]|jgi:hypothetical protein